MRLFLRNNALKLSSRPASTSELFWLFRFQINAFEIAATNSAPRERVLPAYLVILPLCHSERKRSEVEESVAILSWWRRIGVNPHF
jgi:hypothetical protein